jgi:hypothetical protein
MKDNSNSKVVYYVFDLSGFADRRSSERPMRMQYMVKFTKANGRSSKISRRVLPIEKFLRSSDFCIEGDQERLMISKLKGYGLP